MKLPITHITEKGFTFLGIMPRLDKIWISKILKKRGCLYIQNNTVAAIFVKKNLTDANKYINHQRKKNYLLNPEAKYFQILRLIKY